MATVIDAGAPAVPVEPVGKSALCRILRWSRPTLDLRLETDPRFPVLRRGAKGGGWSFDTVAVIAYLSGASPVSRAAAVAGDVPEAASSVDVDAPKVIHLGEQTARQRRDQVQAEILEDKLRRDRGELVQAEVMRQVITKMVVHLGKGMDRLADQVVEKLGLPESNADVIRELTDELRVTMVAELNVLLEPGSRGNPRPAVG